MTAAIPTAPLPEGVNYLLTVPQVCEALHMSRAAIYRHFASGDLPSVRIGRSRRVRLFDLNNFIAAQK